MKMKIIRFLLWAITAILFLFAIFVFPSFSSLLFLLGALVATPIPILWNYLRGRGLHNGVRALLAIAIFLAGCLSAPSNSASDAIEISDYTQAYDSNELIENSSSVGTGKILAESDSEPDLPIWNISSMGNNPNILLSGGNIYCGDSLTILPEEDFSSYSIMRDSHEKLRINRPISYINVWNGKIIYRDDTTRCIYSYDIETQSNLELLSVNAGEILVADGKIFFSDLGRGASLFRASLDGTDITQVVLRSTGSFVVSGEHIFYMGNDQILYSGILSSSGNLSGTPKILASPVERFFLDDKGLLVESGNTIFHIATEGMDAEKVYSSDNDTMRLVGVYNDTVFYQENGSLCIINSKQNPVTSDTYLYYSSPVVNKDKGIIVVAYDRMTDDIRRIKAHLLVINHQSFDE